MREGTRPLKHSNLAIDQMPGPGFSPWYPRPVRSTSAPRSARPLNAAARSTGSSPSSEAAAAPPGRGCNCKDSAEGEKGEGAAASPGASPGGGAEASSGVGGAAAGEASDPPPRAGPEAGSCSAGAAAGGGGGGAQEEKAARSSERFSSPHGFGRKKVEMGLGPLVSMAQGSQWAATPWPGAATGPRAN